jgi:hypothetical protein
MRSTTFSPRGRSFGVIGFAFKFARNARGRASNLYEAKLYRSANATRRALISGRPETDLCRFARAAKPLAGRHLVAKAGSMKPGSGALRPIAADYRR